MDKVLIVEDYNPVRLFIKNNLASSCDIQDVDNAADAIEKCKTESFNFS